MNLKKIKIVADSSCDITELDGVPFKVAPLKIITADKEYTDNEDLSVLGMVDDLQSYNGRSSTSCPSPSDWLEAFGDAETVYCITITGTLSGSYNSAITAKGIYEEANPTRKVFVLNTLSAGPEITLIIEKLREFILSGKDFDYICENILKYSRKTGLLFMLKSMKNLANNGRVSPLIAKMAGLLGICIVGKASDKGDLEPLSKCRGEAKSLLTITEHLASLGFKGGKVSIAHCFNEGAADKLKALIEKRFENVSVTLRRCGGLCSFYAEKGGLLVGFEKA